MAELGPIPFQDAPAAIGDTRGLAAGLEQLSRLGQSIITNDVLGDLREEVSTTLSEEVDAVERSDERAQELAEDALLMGEGRTFLEETRRLQNAARNAPTPGARARAELKVQEVLQRAAARSPRLRDQLLQEFRATTSANADLSALGMRDATLNSNQSFNAVNERIDQLKDIAYKSISSGGLGMSAPFGTPQFAKEYEWRNAMVQEANKNDIALNLIKSSESLSAEALEETWRSNVFGRGSGLTVMYTDLTDTNSPLFQIADLHRKNKKGIVSDEQLLQATEDFRSTTLPQITLRIEAAKQEAERRFAETWSGLTDSPQYTKAREELDEEFAGLDQVISVMDSNTPEAWEILRNNQQVRVAGLQDRYPIARTLSDLNEMAGADMLTLVTKNDKTFNSTEGFMALSNGLYNLIGNEIPLLSDYVATESGIIGIDDAETRRRKHESSLSNDEAPFGGNATKPTEVLVKATSDLKLVDRQLTSGAPITNLFVDRNLVPAMEKNMLAAMLHKNAAQKSEEFSSNIRKAWSDPKYIEALSKGDQEGIKSLASIAEEYFGNQRNSYDSLEDMDNLLDQRYAEAAEFINVDLSSLNDDGSIKIEVDEKAFQNSQLQSRRRNRQALNNFKDEMLKLEQDATTLNRIRAHLEWARRGGVDQPSYRFEAAQ